MSDAMRKIRIEKITLNMGCGAAASIENAKKILELVSAGKVVITKTRKRTTFNVPKNRPIGCKVTVRKNAREFLRRMLEARDNTIQASSFDATGNFSFGIKEYIDIPGMEYQPRIGIIGMDVCVTLERPGYRVKRRRLSGKIGKRHAITKEEAMSFMRENFNVAIRGKEK